MFQQARLAMQYDRSSRSCSLKRSCPAPGRLGVRLALGSLVAQQVAGLTGMVLRRGQ